MEFAPVEYKHIYEGSNLEGAGSAQYEGESTSAGSTSTYFGPADSSQPRDSRMSGGRDSRVPERRSAGYAEPPAKYGFGTKQRNKKGLLGLSNLGNTCFMNSALQCLTHTHGLQKYFRMCSHTYTPHNYTSKSPSSRQKLLMAFAHWFERDWGKSVSAAYHSPEDILRSVQALNPTFQGYQQQDAQEFLRCVLDNVHEELQREVPDDLRGHLSRCFGIEVPGDVHGGPSGASSASGGRGGSRPSQEHTGTGSGSVWPGSSTSPMSSTRQLMQLCQSTEGTTDAGEIRLSAHKPGVPPATGREAALPSSASSTASASDLATGSEADGASSASHVDSVMCCPTPASSSSAPAKEGEKPSEFGTHPESIISELFQGKIVSMVRCLECGRTSRTQEVIYDVSVPIPNPNEAVDGRPPDVSQPNGQGLKGPTLAGMLGGIPGRMKGWFYDKGVDITDCLRKYCAPEYLTGKDKYFCEHCKRKTEAEKRIALKEPPEVLVVHIKRFRYDASWFNGTKNSRVVTFPVTRNLDLSTYMDGPASGSAEYRLVGLIQHIGSMGGGHYIAYCQHKRKPQEWWEFDDAQVNSVSPEQVERAEPYVLFYQRVPSKGSKLDRQTFKTNRKQMEQLIQRHLMGNPSKESAPSASPDAPRQRAQQAVEEMRHYGPAMRGLLKAPPAELEVAFVTKHWYVRLTTMSNPGPIDNYEHLGPHGLLGLYSAEMATERFIPISRSLFQSLVRKYGGGPAIHALEICPRCQTYLRAYNDRKQAEFDLVSKYDTKDTGDGIVWYLVDALWVNKWKRYVRAEHVTDIRDMSAPGPITNERLFTGRCEEKQQDSNPGAVKQNLRLRIDYIGVNARVWWLFMHVHGGGPPICREELDIYSAAASPETELRLDELRGPGARDFARRVSRQFVDECHGDLDLYERTYGRAEEPPAPKAAAVAPAAAAAEKRPGAGAEAADASGPAPVESASPAPSAASAVPAATAQEPASEPAAVSAAQPRAQPPECQAAGSAT